MRKHLPVLVTWAVAYVALIVVGARTGTRPVIIPTFLLLGQPPFCFCMRATRKVMSRTRRAFPEQWTAMNRGMKLELRCFLYDERTFGDETIDAWKRELRWWTRAGLTAIVLFPLTLLLVERISR